MIYQRNFMTVLLSSLVTVLVVVQRSSVLGLYIKQTHKRSVTDCHDHGLVADRCSKWRDLDFCANHQREMQFVCNKTCNYCVPDQWVGKRIWGQIQVPDNAMEGPRLTETENKTMKPFVQILGKEDLDAAVNAIVNELQFHDKEPQPKPKTKQSSKPLTVEIMGRVQSNNKSSEEKKEIANQQREPASQNKTRSSTVELAEEMSRRIINELASRHKDEAKYKPENLQQDLSKLLQIVATSSNVTQDSDQALTTTAPTTSPSHSRFELNTNSAKIPLYLYENNKEGGRENDEKEKIKEASAAIKNVLKLFNQKKKTTTFHKGLDAGITTGVGTVKQLLHNIEASRSTAQKNLKKNLQIVNVDGVASDDESGTWERLARKLALQLQRAVRHMTLRESAHEHEKAILKKQLFYLMRHQDDEDSEDDDHDDDAANSRRGLGS